MKLHMQYIYLTCFALMGACASVVPIQPPATESNIVESDGIASKLFATDADKARKLFTQGKYEQAVIEFRKLIDFEKDEIVRRDARLELARCLIKLQNYNGTLKMLQPFPDNPQKEYERRGLAIAGEALLRDDRPVEAEIILEIALGNYEPEKAACESWVAPSCANLACAYLNNSKYAQAVVLYRRASEMYRHCDRYEDAHEADTMAVTIEALININKKEISHDNGF